MWRKSFVIFGLVFSGCAGGPKVSPCVYSAEELGCWYAPIERFAPKVQTLSPETVRATVTQMKHDGEVSFRSSLEMDMNVCHTADEYQMIIEYIKRMKGQK